MVKLKSMSFQNKQEQAFTLAEVLITLGIIGVVAALTLPSLINRTKNRELHTAFLKTYSELNQVAQKYYADNEISVTEANIDSHSNLSSQIMTEYYKGATKLTNGGMGTKDEEGNYKAFYSIRTLNGHKYSGGENSQGSNSSFICDNSPFYLTASGAVIIFNDNATGKDQTGPVVCVDVNGQKAPNRYGMDYFLFAFTKDGKVVPMGDTNQTSIGTVATNGSAGNFFKIGSHNCLNNVDDISKNTSCAYYALSNTHPNKTGKDYWNDFLGEVSFR